jgi:hypothetical protein
VNRSFLEVLKAGLLALLCIVIVKNSDAACISGCAPSVAAPAPSAAPPPDASLPASATGLTDRLTADLTKAVADATAAKDIAAPMRLACWQTLLALVPNIPALPTGGLGQPAGVFDAFELGAEKVEAIVVLADYQIPPAVRLDVQTKCGPLLVRANDVLAKFNLKFAQVGAQIALLPK